MVLLSVVTSFMAYLHLQIPILILIPTPNSNPIPVADQRGARGTPPGGPNSLNFMHFLGNFGKIVCWRPPESWRPHLGEILDPPLRSCTQQLGWESEINSVHVFIRINFFSFTIRIEIGIWVRECKLAIPVYKSLHISVP